jgi:hypothetical protein
MVVSMRYHTRVLGRPRYGKRRPRTDDANPDLRFVGDANVIVENISPSPGSVWFIVYVDWIEPLPIYTDIVVLEEAPSPILRGIPA